jgi:hypothetical protein
VSVESREERVTKNEVLFREVNERIREITSPPSEAEFLCECGNGTCTQPIPMSLGEYERVRADGRHFLIVPGHEQLDIESVVTTEDRYMVVQKRLGTPAEIATATDPRS